MKPRLLITLLLAALFAGLPGLASAAEGARVRALLVLASNARGASDSRLASYEPTLKRLLRFESYKLSGEGSASLGGGKAAVKIGPGHSLELEPEKSDGRGVRLRFNWHDGSGRSLMNTGLVLRPGVPAVLGGPSSGGKDGEVWAVILVAD